MTTTLITGANRGIGLELCRQLSDRGETVIGACRTPNDALTGLGIRIESGVDMTDGDAIERMALRLEEHPIDTLILNAGILQRTSLERLDIDCIRNQFEVNSLGPLRVVHALLDNLKAGHQGLCDTPESSAGLLARIDELSLENTGTFWHQNGDVLPW